jgi:putative endonuclease
MAVPGFGGALCPGGGGGGKRFPQYTMAGLDPAIHALNDVYMPRGFVYILASKRNGTLYTGVSSDPIGRIVAHREGRGSEFVKKYGVHRLVWFEEHPLYTNAMQRETSLKRWKRAWKIDIIEKTNPNWDDLFEQLPF